MIPFDVEIRIALYFFRRYLPEEVDLNLSSILLPHYVFVEEEDEEPSADEMVRLAIEFLDEALEEYNYE